MTPTELEQRTSGYAVITNGIASVYSTIDKARRACHTSNQPGQVLPVDSIPEGTILPMRSIVDYGTVPDKQVIRVKSTVLQEKPCSTCRSKPTRRIKANFHWDYRTSRPKKQRATMSLRAITALYR